MKKLILTLAVGLLTLASCTKDKVQPSTTKSEVVLETRFVTQDSVPVDTFYALQFGTGQTENWCQHLFIGTCGMWGINTNFDSNSMRRVEIYKAGDNVQSAVWIGEIGVNPTDSTFIIQEIMGQYIDVVPIQCDGLTRLQIQE